MRAEDLSRAQRLLADLTQTRDLAARFNAGEPLSLCIGEGAHAREIVLSPDYCASLRRDVSAALSDRVARLASDLAAIGVEVSP